MDSTPPSPIVREPAVPASGPGHVQLLLRGQAGVGAEPAVHALVGRGIHATPFLRGAQNDRLVAAAGSGGGLGSSAAFTPGHGLDGRLCQAALEPQSSGPQAFSLSAEGSGDRATQSGVEHRYHLHPAKRWVCVSGRGHRLVQPVYPGLGVVDQPGSRFLCRALRAGVEAPAAGDLQHRPRRAVHQHPVPGPAPGGPGAPEHGWAGPGLRQHLRRALLAQPQVRGGVSLNAARYLWIAAWLAIAVPAAQSQVPQAITYQGSLTAGAVPYSGVGLFKFALVNSNGTATFWSNDGSSVGGGQPNQAITNLVTRGLFTVVLGDSAARTG